MRFSWLCKAVVAVVVVLAAPLSASAQDGGEAAPGEGAAPPAEEGVLIEDEGGEATADPAPAEEPPAEEPPAEEPPAEEPPAEGPPAEQADEDEAFLSGGQAVPGDAAAAEQEAEEGEPGEEEDGEESWEEHKKRRDHFFQGFVSIFTGTGWFMVAPYEKDDENKRCSVLTPSTNPNEPPEGEPICTGLTPLHQDYIAGFAPIPGFEVFAMFRLGLVTLPQDEKKVDEETIDLQKQVGAGIKIYSPSDGLFKISFGVAPLFDFKNPEVGYDFIVHVPIAAHFDFVRWFGAYLQVSPNISFLSEFMHDITYGIGLQGRFP